MDTGLLSAITQLFHQASLGWADAMAPFMSDLRWRLLQIGSVFFFLGYFICADFAALYSGFIYFAIGNSIAMVMTEWGWVWIDLLFNGVKHLAYFLGAPPLDPSAIAGLGVVVTDPIAKSL